MRITHRQLEAYIQFMETGSVTAAAERMRRARWKKDLYESEPHQRMIRGRYLELIAKRYPGVGPVVVVDASRPAAEVSSELTARVDRFLDTGRVEDAA